MLSNQRFSGLGVQDTVYDYVQIYVVEYEDFLTKELEVWCILFVLEVHVDLYILLGSSLAYTVLNGNFWKFSLKSSSIG